MAVPVMRGIERAAEQPDAARRQEAEKRAQGRTWPVPRTTYL